MLALLFSFHLIFLMLQVIYIVFKQAASPVITHGQNGEPIHLCIKKYRNADPICKSHNALTLRISLSIKRNAKVWHLSDLENLLRLGRSWSFVTWILKNTCIDKYQHSVRCHCRLYIMFMFFSFPDNVFILQCSQHLFDYNSGPFYYLAILPTSITPASLPAPVSIPISIPAVLGHYLSSNHTQRCEIKNLHCPSFLS